VRRRPVRGGRTIAKTSLADYYAQNVAFPDA
jgi:hypothetical protein